MLKRNILVGLAIISAVGIALAIRSKSIGQSATTATTQPVATVSPQAQVVLNDLRSGYQSAKTLAISGTLDGNFDIDGSTSTRHGQFTGLYSGGLFRSEVKETDTTSAPGQGNAASTQPAVADTLLGNTGKKLFIFLPMRNGYMTMDLPEGGKVDLDSIGNDLADVLRSQDLSLALAMSGNASAELLDMASSVDRVDDAKIDGQALPTIAISYPRFDITLSVDPQTHLLRRATADLTKNAKMMGAGTIKSAVLTTNFNNKIGVPAEAAAFDWTPPPGAQEMKAGDGGDAAIEGKPAPPFSLKGLDGKVVDSKSLLGTVYVLDFWATWCGPCVASLPELDSIYKDYQSKGVKFFALNQQEDKEAVQKFVTDSKLSIPVLLDADGSVCSQYDSEGAIPFTAVIGKDGKVIKAGLFGADENQIRPFLDSALKK